MNPIDDLFADESKPPAPTQQSPVATEPQPPVAATPVAKSGNAIDALFGETSAPAQSVQTPESRPYLDRITDIPGDITDQFTQGISTVAEAPGKIFGTTENPYEKSPGYEALVDRMIKRGVSEKKAKGTARSQQMQEGLLDLPLGASEAAFSWLFGPIRSMASRPLEEATGIPKEATEFVSGLLLGRPKYLKKSPISSELKESSNTSYTIAKAIPIEVKDSAVARIGHDIEFNLRSPTHSFRPGTAKETFNALEELKTPSGGKIADIDSVRRVLGRVSREVNAIGGHTEDAKAARTAISMLDNHMTKLQPADISHNAHLLPDLLDTMQKARGDYAAHIRTYLIERAIDRGGLNAATGGTGANVENALRQRFKQIITTPRLANNYSKQELDLIREMAEGTVARNTARQLGKFAPTGPVSTLTSLGTGALLGGVKGMEATALIGYAAKKAADAAAKRSARGVAETVGARSPLYRTGAKEEFVIPKKGLAPVNELVRRMQEEGQP